MRAITYGPFPEDKQPDPAVEFRKIRNAGFDTIRLFTLPDRELLDAAREAEIQVFAGLDWWQFGDFFANPGILSAARIRLASWLSENGAHPALSGVYVGNEISADLVRWMGAVRVREALEDLIDLGRSVTPHILFAYANFPSTEYLEPANADFSAFNIYLENPEPYAAYLRRLQNIAGDRPLVISEFGLDSSRNSPETQAETLRWGMEISHREQTAGFTVYAWSDLWQNGGREILDWDFGITDRTGEPKPAFHTCRQFAEPELSAPRHRFSVIVCTRNGKSRIGSCLRALSEMSGGPYELMVIDDGSTDGTGDFVAKNFPDVCLCSIPPSGLSAARNKGAELASGEILAFTDDDCEPDKEWIARLDQAFRDPDTAAAGGPNLPPRPENPTEAVVCSAPGAPSHVLLDDTTAEHIPGCNLSVRKRVFDAIGGFDPAFRTAGDDVDFCWRLSDHRFRIAFVPGAFVWHWRRPSLRAFLAQQKGYGKAEKILIGKHPERFTEAGEARWKGFVYGGGAVRITEESVIYHGAMGRAGYQRVANRMLPLRPFQPVSKLRFLHSSSASSACSSQWSDAGTATAASRSRNTNHPPLQLLPIPSFSWTRRTGGIEISTWIAFFPQAGFLAVIPIPGISKNPAPACSSPPSEWKTTTPATSSESGAIPKVFSSSRFEN